MKEALAVKNMLRFLKATCRRLHRDERGNIFVLFGATAIPLLLLMGGAIDLARFSRYKAELANAVDSAALALARKGQNFTEAQATQFVRDYVTAFSVEDDQFAVHDFDVDMTSQGYRVMANGVMQTMFLPLGSLTNATNYVTEMDMHIVSEVVHSSNRVELALVFDNTGSMNCGNTQSGTCYNNYANPPSNSRIVAVKAAATTLVNTLIPGTLEDPDQIKIALVPFEGMVNVGITSGPSNSWATPPSWIDWNASSTTLSATNGFAKAKFNGVNLAKYTFPTPTGSKYVSHGWLFRKLGIAWDGCVEMRPASVGGSTNYELTDTAPDTSVPNSLFVPYFWPDEPDSSATVGSSGATRNNNGGYNYPNDYLNDLTAYSTPAAAQLALGKYTATNPSWHSGRKTAAQTPAPYIYGPNRGCPNPIIPLTKGDAAGKTKILNGISQMVAYYATGTYIPAGIMWGWHVLSPGLPFSEGLKPGDEYYDKTVKAMVLFTDGDNTVTSDGNHNKSRYSAWGYIGSTAPDGNYRLGSSTTTSDSALNSKTSAACENAKAAGIRMYTISFGSLDNATTTMMRNCATVDKGEALYYHAPGTSDLQEIFHAIGEDLSEIHLSM